MVGGLIRGKGHPIDGGRSRTVGWTVPGVPKAPRRKPTLSPGRRVQLAIRGVWMIGLGVAGLVAVYLRSR